VKRIVMKIDVDATTEQIFGAAGLARAAMK
jgi:hypothetical protein